MLDKDALVLISAKLNPLKESGPEPHSDHKANTSAHPHWDVQAEAMDQSQHFSSPRHQGAHVHASASVSSAPALAARASRHFHDELHMAGLSPQRQHISFHEYTPQIKLDYPTTAIVSGQPQPQPHQQQQQSYASVPGVLQPGGLVVRPPAVSASTAPAISTVQSSLSSSQDLVQSPSQLPPQQLQHPHQRPQSSSRSSFTMSHAYSRSSPSSGYDASGGYNAYHPTTPGGSSSSASQFMSPSDIPKYSQPGSQRHFSNTPLGLADIRPRADSNRSESGPGTMSIDLSNTQPGTSNYMAPWPIYAFDWCKWRPQANGAGKVAVGSYLEDGHNFIQILDSHATTTPQDVYTPGSSKYTLEFSKVAEATHSYPVTRLLWEPPSSQKQSTDLLATSGDHLRLWSLPSDATPTPGSTITRRGIEGPGAKLTPLALLSNSKTPDHTAPLTSLDWNTMNPALIITSSIDTTCTIWDIPSLTAKTQLIAHDKEVYDVRFCANTVDVFVSCGQDGSVRMFDLRSLEHSTIIYEPTGKDDKVHLDTTARVSPSGSQHSSAGSPPPLLRLATSPHDTHLLATFAQDSGAIRILDARQPGQALLELRGHTGNVNCLDWSPLRRGLLATGGDDCQVLLWDLMNANSSSSINGAPQPEGGRSPVASWASDYEVANLAWAPHLQSGEYGEWLGVTGGRGVWGTRVS
ncbi:DDB1- and CUL4-associated factor 7 [Geosmithia morbida]|uniref:DDB1- and CUL4-associated factor 7 n=1 Tax=Geosmithia morbida TaxID=1094350 RepID=A0A9P4YNB8_9HYPO|nr:DDB1- and CUL4-associated factor 7 [Geosmithia morbida]KAF4120111.1 DDB1- and CUL4-associated factor 7 [Geosmithia morbida]